MANDRDTCKWCCDYEAIARNSETFKSAVLALLCKDSAQGPTILGPTTVAVTGTTTPVTGLTLAKGDLMLQVVADGGTAVGWTVTLEGLLADGTTYGTVLTHDFADQGSGGIVVVSHMRMTALRFNVTALSLGSASGIILLANAV